MYLNFTFGNGSQPLWISIILRQYEINDSSVFWLGWAVEAIEMASILLTTLTFWFCFLAMRTKVFGHPNVTRIMLAFLLDGYILAVSRIYLFTYQLSHPYFLRVAPELGYPSPIELDIILLLGSFLRQYYVYANLLSMVIVQFPVLERAFAFYYLEDYEKNRRRWIETVLLSIKTGVCTIMAFLNIMGWVANTYAVLLAIALFVMAIVGFARLHALNKRKFVEITSMRVQSRYTLSLRYQVMENERVLRMITVVFRAMTGCGIWQLAVALTTSAFIPLESALYDFLQATFETGVAITPNIIVVAAISQIPGAWAGLKRRAMRRTTSTIEPVVLNAPASGEAQQQLYFQQLRASWQ